MRNAVSQISHLDWISLRDFEAVLQRLSAMELCSTDYKSQTYYKRLIKDSLLLGKAFPNSGLTDCNKVSCD